jgi:hypothetical protein
VRDGGGRDAFRGPAEAVMTRHDAA